MPQELPENLPSEYNKRIAKNTLLLYFRQIVTMVISLFTVRIVLKVLGVEDYGIHNVVGGIVLMFGFISNTMGAASQRFLAFEIGTGKDEGLVEIFSLTMHTYIGIAFIVVLLSETVGLWFFNTQLNIPENRMGAALWVYQFSVFSFVFSMLRIPYNAVIIAREKMSVYAYISIIDAALKLLIVYLLIIVSYDKLKLYAALLFGIYVLDTLIYYVYSKLKFKECRYVLCWNSTKLIEMLSFAWWAMFGSIANIAKNQGTNILLNIFFGPVVNAARGISFQVKNTIANFNNNFFMAVRPTIVKEYAAGNHNSMLKLMYRSTKLSYFLMLGLSLPILLETEYILGLWLGQIPQYVVIFTQLVLIDTMFDAVALPIAACVQAKGIIRNYQVLVGGFALLNLPLSYGLLKWGYAPQSVFWLAIALSAICFALRLWIIRDLLQVSLKDYLLKIVFTLSVVTVACIPLPYLVSELLQESLLRVMLTFMATLFTLFFSILLVGLTATEKVYVQTFIRQRLKRWY